MALAGSGRFPVPARRDIAGSAVRPRGPSAIRIRNDDAPDAGSAFRSPSLRCRPSCAPRLRRTTIPAAFPCRTGRTMSTGSEGADTKHRTPHFRGNDGRTAATICRGPDRGRSRQAPPSGGKRNKKGPSGIPRPADGASRGPASPFWRICDGSGIAGLSDPWHSGRAGSGGCGRAAAPASAPRQVRGCRTSLRLARGRGSVEAAERQSPWPAASRWRSALTEPCASRSRSRVARGVSGRRRRSRR